MDIQLKKGMLDVCILAAIKEEASYGYRILKKLQPYVRISESTLYPILRRLEGAALLSVHNITHNGRLRKYYRITALGLKRIRDFFDEWKELEAIYGFVSQTEERLLKERIH